MSCNHHRQPNPYRFATSFMPCATPGCPEGRAGPVLTVMEWPDLQAPRYRVPFAKTVQAHHFTRQELRLDEGWSAFVWVEPLSALPIPKP